MGGGRSTSSPNLERLLDLAVISIENEVSTSIDFSDLIDSFAMKKARKIAL